jgi:hypothetical protein
LAPPGAKEDAASPGRSRAQKRVVWSLEAETRRWPRGWNVSAQTFESCAWESVARGGTWGAGAENAAGPVVLLVLLVVLVLLWVCERVVVGPEGKFGMGVPAVGEERSQWRMAPSEPPETRIGWTGCHASAVFGLLSWIGRVGGKRNVQQTSFLCPRRTTHSFIERMSNTRTVWSREALASRFPWGAHESACMVFLCWWLPAQCQLETHLWFEKKKKVHSVVSEVPVRVPRT